MLSHASRSRHVDPGRPPAADGGLRSQYPAAVAGWSKRIDPLLRQEVEGVHRLGTALPWLSSRAVGASTDDQLDGHGANSVRYPFSH